MLVTFEVSSLLMSSAFSDVHPSNMLAMLVARDVSRPDKSTDCKELAPLKKLLHASPIAKTPFSNVAEVMDGR